MPKPRQIVLVIVACVAAPVTTSARAGAVLDLWQNSGSTFRQVTDGTRRELVYEKPRAGIEGDGIKPGTVLFQGKRDGNQYSGTAYVFSKRCGPLPYSVSGQLSAGETQITLRGLIPVALDAECNPTRHQPDVLQLKSLQTNAAKLSSQTRPVPPAPAASAAQVDDPARQQSELERSLAEGRAQQALIEKLQTENSKLKSDAARIADEPKRPTFLRKPNSSQSDASGGAPITVGTIPERATGGGFAWLPIMLAVFLTSLGAFSLLVYRHRPMFAVLEAIAAPYAATRSAITEMFGAMRRTAAMPPSQPSRSPAPAIANPPFSPVPQAHDDVGALVAMGLANSFIDDVRNSEIPNLDQNDLREKQLATLSLAARQIDLAVDLDRDAILQLIDEGNVLRRYSISQLKAWVLYYEALVHRNSDEQKSISALIKATEYDPENAAAFYVLGCLQIASENKTEALAALERGIDLDPGDEKVGEALLVAQSMPDAGMSLSNVSPSRRNEYPAR